MDNTRYKPQRESWRLITVVQGLMIAAVLAGCFANVPFMSKTPVQTTYTYTDSYDRVWGVVTSALHTEGLSLNVIDKDSGVISGVKRLEPSTMDMLTNYSARVAANVSVQRTGGGVEVRIDSINERKYEEHDWRPAGAADAYSATIFESINSQLSQVNQTAGNSDQSYTSPNTTNTSRATSSTLTPEREQIQKVQSVLNDLGYAAGVEDGIMGRKTSTAISAFQRDSGIDVTGELNEETVEALRSAWLKI